MRKCIFPGSFNPFTVGHLDIVKQALSQFGEVIVAVADITYKDDIAPLDCRVKMAKKSLSALKNVSVIKYCMQTTELLSSLGIYSLIRGIRNEDDWVYEKQLETVYKSVEPKTEIIYIKSNYNHISSSLVRKISHEGGRFDEFVSNKIVGDIKRLYGIDENRPIN